jgi:hypothetical protein
MGAIPQAPAEPVSGATNPFGGAPVAALEPAKSGTLAAGVNATPNNKPLKQILHEEKKQRSFFRTYWLTSFVCSAVIAVIAGVMLPSLGSPEPGDITLNPFVAHAGNAVAMFTLVGLGLFVGRALIILGRRMSKRKSIRYFDSTTLIVAALTILESAALAVVTTMSPDQAGATHYTATENIAYSFVIGVAVIFPMMAFLSVPIGFFKGLGRTSYADGA